jgi:acyl-CoA thioesterase FadM
MSPCSYGDELVGTQYVVRVGRSSLVTEFVFRKGTDELICQGRIIQMFIDLREKKIPERDAKKRCKLG